MAGGKEKMTDVLYETQYHAMWSSGPHPASQGQVNKSRGGGLFSLLSPWGLHQLKGKLVGYNLSRSFNRRMSLFISPNGEHVGIAAGNQITILQKDDNYINPCGIFISDDELSIFAHGAWSEPQGILGVVDHMDRLFFIKSNGQEISRTTAGQLNLSTPIVDLIVLDDLNAKKSCLCGFCIVTADGLLHHIEVTQDPGSGICSMPMLNNQLGPGRQLPLNVSCLDYHPGLSLVVLVDGAVGISRNHPNGFYSVSLWRITKNMEFESLFCTPQLEGLFLVPKGHAGPFTTPKVIISPKGQYVAVLDLTGCLNIFSLRCEPYALSFISFDKRNDSQISAGRESGTRELLSDIIDVTWWSDGILIIAKKSGIITMFDVYNGVKSLENNVLFSSVVLERVMCHEGYVFVLECGSSKGRLEIGNVAESISKNSRHPDADKFCWSLISFVERSVSEMYSILISNQQYQDALDFANSHGLDKDENFKSQWLHSDQGTHEIDAFLSNIKDQTFVLSECVNKGPTEDAVRALLSFGLSTTDQYEFRGLDDDETSLVWDFRKFRLQLLQCRDRLETFLGINMGRFSMQEYRKFKSVSLHDSAISLAESGKIGAVNLLFKRHPYSLALNVLNILSAIPEIIPVESYCQLLPGRCPPSSFTVRDGDWVESERMASFIMNLSSNSEDTIDMKTEVILKHCMGFVWPTVTELSDWYMNRARDIDNFTGQLDNCFCLIDFACRKGIVELQQFLEDISYLHHLIYSTDEEICFSMKLVAWEQLSDYEKFKVMLNGTKPEVLVKQLKEKAITFMRNRSCSGDNDSFLVRWLKEMASENKMDICLAVIEEGCKDFQKDRLFRDEIEAMEVTTDCAYLCTATDQWNTLASILSKLPCKNLKEKSALSEKDFSPRQLGSPRFYNKNDRVVNSEMQFNLSGTGKRNSASQNTGGHIDEPNFDTVENLKRMVKTAEGHVEVGRLLAYYQVPKPMSFFQGSHLDEKSVKQLLRLILSKFGRRQPVRSDNDWANMWRDMQCFQEKAFPFLDLEYMLMEFCRGLLKAGKFSLARNYLKGTGNMSLATEKAENLVIQAAREYFFSASSLSCNEIWKAKECLNLLPNSDNVKAEAGIIDALTIKLPNLGITLLPMQFKQIRNPMEIVNMVITSQTGAYLNVDELIEIAQLLGLSSQDDTASIQEAVAREAAVTGDLQVAFDLCLILSKKGHGPIWDLCAAIARGPGLENMDTSARKQLLGFALSHCDEDSIGELLHAWKDIDLKFGCEKLMVLTGTSPPGFSVQSSSFVSLPKRGSSGGDGLGAPLELVEGAVFDGWDNYQEHSENIKHILSTIAKDIPTENSSSLFHILKDDGKVFSFAALNLPWLIELSKKVECSKKATLNEHPLSGKWYLSVRMQALLCMLSWLAMNDVAPNDDLIASIAKSMMETSTSEEEDAVGCSFLLNLMDAFRGVELIEEQIIARKGYHELNNIMNLGVIYSSVHSSGIGCSDPDQRRLLLLHKFQEKHASFCSGEMDNNDRAQSTFWGAWEAKLEEQKRLADQARQIEKIVPGAETARFLSGDINYIEGVIFSFVDSMKLEKRFILKDAIELADAYGVQRAEVLLRFLGCALVSEHWTNDEILAELLDYKEDVISSSEGVINVISSVVYPEIDGRNKQRLSYVYSILSACHLRLKRTREPISVMSGYLGQPHTVDLAQFYKLLEQECRRVSFIRELNFKNIAGLVDLNFEHFNAEVCNHISESSVLALAEMVQNLLGIYNDSADRGLISQQSVYKYHVLSHLETLGTRRKDCLNLIVFQDFVNELEGNYESCKVYIRALPEEDILNIVGRYCTLCLPHNCSESQSDESSSKPCLVVLLNFWIKVADDIQEFLDQTCSFSRERLSGCLHIFKGLLLTGEVSTSQGWSTVSMYANLSLASSLIADISSFCKAMAFSGCYFKTIAEIFSGQEPRSPDPNEDVSQFYVNTIDSILSKVNSNSDDCRNLLYLLSSLSKLQSADREVIYMVRYRVWRKLIAFSDDLQMSKHMRMYILQMMEAITGKNVRSLPVELASVVEPWDGWQGSYIETGGPHDQGDISSRVTNTLVALKSTQLSAAISPMIEITSEDLKTLDSAVSCFFRLSEIANSEPHLNILLTVLEEWEGLFMDGKDAKCGEVLEERNDWSSDEWDEGWENLPEETMGKNKQIASSIHPLHTCWMEIIRKLVGLSQLRGVIELMDRSLSKTHGILLSENDAQCLFQLVIGIDFFMGLKMVLMLPYRTLWFQSLSIIEEKLKQEDLSTLPTVDEELLTLVLSSGVLTSIVSNASYQKMFSCFCYSVGHLSRIFQESVLKDREEGGSKTKENVLSLFGRVLFPLFVSELIQAGQFLCAGFIVSQWMHAHSAFSFINIVEVSLRKYLESQLQAKWLYESDVEELSSCKSLVSTVSNLRGIVGDSIQSALSVLSLHMT
uniref:Neuroblastoma-amplified sequence n=1 Tax=Anthurium amnicola TaxID=1678845 RepID=A0A1D1Z3C7_9ARAE